ncbi:RYamide receptor [Amphibalanus amphitrite]|uniref:RYamide receptor n=1 Tax=Amphibalanus amphitrite TaxID=1232801 RepID=A0A6A4VPK4_AMPAM|nr:RYamide receptor [Amphibalanus amphitrite]
MPFLQWRCDPPEPPSEVGFTVIVWISFTILFLAGLIGNGLVCYVVYAAPRMRTVTNLLIANMAAGDLLMTTLCMPLTVVYVVLLRYWPLGDALCRLVSFAQPVSVYVSAYTLVAIAADRYRAIVYPLVPRGSRRRARVVIAVVWTLAAATSVPAAVTSRTFVPPDPWYMMHERRVCQERWEDEGRRYYTTAVLLLQFFLPVTVLTLTYGRIAVEVWGRGGLPSTRQDNRQLRLARARRKTVQMMVIVVAAFTICWLPNHVLQIVYDIHRWVGEWPGIGYLYTATYWLSMASCVCNPIIYCGMNAQFRAAFSAVASRVCLRCRRPPAAISRAGSSVRSRATSYTQWTLRSLRLRRSNGSAHSCHAPEPAERPAAPLNTK